MNCEIFVCTCILGNNFSVNVLSSRFMVFLLPKRNFNDRPYREFKNFPHVQDNSKIRSIMQCKIMSSKL